MAVMDGEHGKKVTAPLISFPGQHHPDIGINVIIEKFEHLLQVKFNLQGDLNGVKLPPKQDPQRADELWQHTCLEVFVQIEDRSAYWEVNCSPSSCWNVYRFEGYRSGMQREELVNNLPYQHATKTDVYEGTFTLDLSALLPCGARSSLRLGVAAVIEEPQGQLSYWALCHPRSYPDFHDCQGWTIVI